MSLAIMVLLAFVGYLALLRFILSKIEMTNSVPAIAAVVLFVYACIAAPLIAFSRSFHQFGILLYIVMGLFSLFYCLYRICLLFHKRIKVHVHILLATAAYVLAILYITTFMRENGSNYRIQMELFHWTVQRAAYANDAVKHFALNIAMFIPLGLLVPLVSEARRGRFLSGIMFSALLSVMIETWQFISHSGICDIDDLIANLLGGMIGAILIWLFSRFSRRK